MGDSNWLGNNYKCLGRDFMTGLTNTLFSSRKESILFTCKIAFKNWQPI